MRRALLVPLILLAGCVAPSSPPPPPPPANPPPREVPPPVQPPRPDAHWRDRAYTAGSWSYERDARGSRAMFGNVGTDARLVLRCDRGEQRLYLSRAGSGSGPLTVRTSSTTRSVPVQPTGGAQPYVAAALTPGDPLLDAIAFSRGRFVVDQPGEPGLVLPTWAEIGRVIEDCRG